MTESERVLLGVAPIVLPGGELGFVDCRVLCFPWRGTESFVTIAIKTSASFANDHLGGRLPAYWVEPPRFEAVDVAPGKSACDLIVKGSATIPHLPSGYVSGRRDLELRVGSTLRLRFFLDARRPGRVPLTPEVLIDEGGAPGLDLGPRKLPPRERLLLGDFELEGCQLAPKERRLAFDEPLDQISMNGFFEPLESLEVVLPSFTPRLLVDPTGPHRELEEAPVVLDTLVLDLDRQAFDMVWRSVIKGQMRDVGRLILGFGPDLPEELEERWGKILAELPRGRFSLTHAIEDVDEDKDPPELDPASLEMAKLESWEFPVGPTPTISLDQYARVTAELLEARDERKLVLAKHGLDEDSFAIEEKAWGSRMSEVAEEEPSLATQLGEKVIQYQAGFAHRSEEKLGIAEYALLVAHIEKRDPAKVFAEHKLLERDDGQKRGMTQPAFMRLERRVDAMIDAEPSLQDELDRELERVRATLPEDYVEDDLPEEVKKALK